MTGKTPGTDLREGVFTLPVLIASQSEPLLAERLAAGERDLAELLPLIEAGGGVTGAQSEARTHAQAALEAISDLPDCDWTTALRDIPQGVLAQI